MTIMEKNVFYVLKDTQYVLIRKENLVIFWLTYLSDEIGTGFVVRNLSYHKQINLPYNYNLVFLSAFILFITYSLLIVFSLWPLCIS